MNKDTAYNETSKRNWPGLVAAGALFAVGWLLVHAYSELPSPSPLPAADNQPALNGNETAAIGNKPFPNLP